MFYKQLLKNKEWGGDRVWKKENENSSKKARTNPLGEGTAASKAIG
ncbi:hypothetical protein PCE01_15650 [Pediococcus cellicola]|nr:hypothetical protein PCE01_15650 [Pediococcus cellicola]